MNESQGHWLLRAWQKTHPGAVVPQDLELPLDTAQAWRQLERQLRLKSGELAHSVAEAHGIDVANILEFKPPASNPLSLQVCRQDRILPFDLKADPPLIATSDPRLPPDERDRLKFALGQNFKLVMLSPDDIETGLTRLFAEESGAGGNRYSLELGTHEAGENQNVQIAKAILREAIDARASDVHIHPFVGGYAVRFRVDGVLRRIATIPASTGVNLARYFGAHAGLEPNPLIAQDGRLQLNYGERNVDVRLSILPVFDGIRIVCRLLEQGRSFSLSNSGFSTSDYRALKRLVSFGTGIVMLTGPTGSGKTSTLYALLSELNDVGVNIMTLENPVEYVLPGISQVQVNDAQGLSFGDTLRAILRQDPDVVLVGEIRDEETARIAAQAALTGHMVLSTLHTNDAMAAIPRLLGLGLDAATIADAVVGVVSQRLARKLCSDCSTETAAPLSAAEAEYQRLAGELPARRATGCEACSFTGYRGRLPLAEILEVSVTMRTALLDGVCSVEALREANKGHQTSMTESAKRWLVSGSTTLEEVSRVLGLHFWNELAKLRGASLQIGADDLMAKSHRREARSSLLIVTPDERLAQALGQEIEMPILSALDSTGACEQLRHENSIVAVVIDGRHVSETFEVWLRELRSRLAWSGLPVLFLVDEAQRELRTLIDAFDAHAVCTEAGRNPLAGINDGLRRILT
ncbi:MAG: type II/IV secretion system protein [Rhodocyclaceae bacterium]|nr:type II/IV secretion system protein [Rhodocyclaceae bacterium]